MDDVTLDTVCNRTGLTSNDMRAKFGFLRATTQAEELFHSPTIGTLFISTRHGEHAPYALQALRNGQHVFVEKPLALDDAGLDAIEALFRDNPSLAGAALLMVGYNRRFAPLVRQMKEFIGPLREPAFVHYAVNAGFLPADHWTHDPVEGGGRIVGEVCHFIDTIQYLTDAAPVRVYAECIQSSSAAVTNHDTVSVTLRMSDGSVGVITYVANGDSAVPKERITVSTALSTAVLNNFSSLELYRGGKRSVRKGDGDKGHRDEVRAFIDALRQRRRDVIPLDSLFRTTRATFRILDSLARKEAIDL
jgi:polar amino acid transport system substrate-binding protein